MDFYNLLSLCGSPITNSWKYYAFRYCAAKKFRKKTKNGMYRDIWITDGASNLEELHERTKSRNRGAEKMAFEACERFWREKSGVTEKIWSK